jgi:Na+/melibiose symporter-like transporter
LAGYLNTDAPPTMTQLNAMRIMLIVIQLVALLAALTFIWFYPITRARSEETRRILDKRKTQRVEVATRS